MSNKTDHTNRANAAMAQAKRFYDASGHAGVNGRGSTWSTSVDLDARIMHVSTARMFAELAVHEAAHARGKADGPTPLQVEASSLSDDCTRLSKQLAYDIARGALRPNDHTVLPFGPDKPFPHPETSYAKGDK